MPRVMDRTYRIQAAVFGGMFRDQSGGEGSLEEKSYQRPIGEVTVVNDDGTIETVDFGPPAEKPSFKPGSRTVDFKSAPANSPRRQVRQENGGGSSSRRPMAHGIRRRKS